MLKHRFSLFLVVVLIVSMSFQPHFYVSAENLTTSEEGKFDSGEPLQLDKNVYGKLNSDGTLTISGSGKWDDYDKLMNQEPYKSFDRSTIKKVVIEAGITSIPGYAFKNCTNLAEVQIPEGIREIGTQAFADCSKLYSVSLPSTLSGDLHYTFWNCTSLMHVYFSEQIQQVNLIDTFNGCRNLTSMTIPGAGETYSPFNGCINLQNIDFTGSRNFMSYPNNLPNLKTVHFTGNAPRVYHDGSGEFGWLSNLKNIDIYYPLSNSTWDDFSLSWYGGAYIKWIPYGGDKDKIIGHYKLGDNVQADLFDNGTLNVYGSGPMYNYNYAYYDGRRGFFGKNQRKVVNVIISAGVTSIGDYAFINCPLMSIDLPSGIKSIGNQSFNHTLLDHINIPLNVKTIGKGAFDCCFYLENIELPELQNVGEWAWEGCNRLTTIRFHGNAPIIGENAFARHNSYDYPEQLKVYYPANNSTWSGDKLQNYGGKGVTWISYDDSGYHSQKELRLQNSYQTPDSARNNKSVYENYYLEWKAAYNNYIDAVTKALEESAKESTDKSSRERDIKNEKKMLMQNGYLLLQDQTAPKEVTEAAYEAFASYIYDVILNAPNIDLSDVKATDEDAGKLVSKLSSALRGADPKSYDINGINVNVKWQPFTPKAGFGSVTCKRNGSITHTYLICSSLSSGNEAMRNYLVQLAGLEKSATYEAAHAIEKDVLGVSLTQLTDEYLARKLEPYIQYFSKKKVGNLIKVLKDAYQYYNYLKKLEKIAQNPFDAVSQIESITDSMNEIAFEDDEVKGEVKAAVKALKQASKKVADGYCKYAEKKDPDDTSSGTIQSLISSFSLIYKIFWNCPVDVSVYDSNGSQIGVIGSDDIWYDESKVYLERDGNAKVAYVYTEAPINCNLTATGNGLLDCTIEAYKDNIPTGRNNFYNISLTQGQKLSMNGDKAEISSNGQTIKPNEYIASDQAGSVEINAIVDGQGGVEGAGKYVRGDTVLLMAEPSEGWVFGGWYDGNALVETSRLYEFGAKENKSITAKFIDPNSEDADDSGQPNAVFKLYDTDISLKAGESYQLRVSIPDSPEGTSIFWKSDDDSIACVSDDGVVSALSNGKTKITAYLVVPGTRYGAWPYKTCSVVVAGYPDGWVTVGDKSFWYENGVRQGTTSDPKGVRWKDDKPNANRGREIYDPASDAWYWLDSIYRGAKATGKEVFMPYVYQNESTMPDSEMHQNAGASDAGMQDYVYDLMKNGTGKWVRYDGDGKMLKGWVTIEGALANVYPKQVGNRYYYDTKTGAMAKGWLTIDGVSHHFDEMTGVLLN